MDRLTDHVARRPISLSIEWRTGQQTENPLRLERPRDLALAQPSLGNCQAALCAASSCDKPAVVQSRASNAYPLHWGEITRLSQRRCPRSEDLQQEHSTKSLQSLGPDRREELPELIALHFSSVKADEARRNMTSACPC